MTLNRLPSNIKQFFQNILYSIKQTSFAYDTQKSELELTRTKKANTSLYSIPILYPKSRVSCNSFKVPGVASKVNVGSINCILKSLHSTDTYIVYTLEKNPYVCRIEFFPPKINVIFQQNYICHKVLTFLAHIVLQFQ